MKNIQKKKRQTAMVLMVTLLISMFIPVNQAEVYAAETYKVVCTDSGLNYGAGIQSVFERSDGTVVYCGEHDVFSPVDEGDTKSLSFSKYTGSKMVIKALYYGKGGPKEWSGFSDYSTKKAKCITALAISNAYIQSGEAKSAAETADLDSVDGLKDFWNYIKEKSSPPEDRFDVYRYEGDAWTQSLFTFEYYPKGEGALMKKSTSSYTTNSNGYYLKGAKYGVYTSKADAEDDENKVGTLTTIDGGSSNTLTLDVGTYYVKETKAPDGYELDETIHTLKIKEDETTTLNVKDTPLEGKLQIIKKSDNPDTANNNNYSLKGAEFKVYRDKGKELYVTTLTTDEEGKTNSFSCIADTYYIYETKAPKGFELYEDVITAQVTIGQTVKKTITEHAIEGKIQIRKVSTNENTGDNKNYSLADAKFSIYRDKDKKDKVATLTTNEKGLTESFTCLADTYYVYEDAAPKGFQRIEGLAGTFNTKEAFLELNQKTFVYEIQEKPVTGKIQIVKKSSDSAVSGNVNYTLAGAKFSIYRDKDKKDKVTTLTTDENGKTTAFTGLADTYYVYEDEAPKGFERIKGLVGTFDTADSFLNLEQNYVYTVVNEPVPGAIQIVKKAANPEQVKDNANYSLAGAVFGVFEDRECTKKLKELTTDESGKTTEFTLYADTYYVKELKAPKGFLLNEEVFEAKVTVGQSKTVIVDEMEETGFARVKKVTKGGTVNSELTSLYPEFYTLEGAVYAVYETEADAMNGEFPIRQLTTDANGDTESIELPLGTYYLKEVSPSKGYLLDGAVYTFTVEAGETAVVTSEEMPLFHDWEMIIKKHDAEHPEKGLAGAEFMVRYYPQLNGDIADKTPLREWRFKTDEEGAVYYDQEHYLDGDPLFIDDEGRAVGLVGTYVFTEVKAPYGYILSEEEIVTQIITDEQQTETIYQIPNAANTPQNGKIILQKIDSETKTSEPQTFGSFEGAVYEIFTMDSEGMKVIVDTLTTNASGQAESKLLPLGVYQIRETKAPAGYVINPQILTVEIKSTDSSTETFTVSVEGEESPTTVEVYKLESGSETFVEGAVLAVFDGNETLIEQWVSVDHAHVMKAIPEGSYVLRELSTPDGYVKAEDKVFTVEEKTEVQRVVLENDDTKVEVTKSDFVTGEPVVGAKLQIIDEEGREVASWIAGKNPHVIEKLKPGKYTLIETYAPDGYIKAESVEFIVEETGEIQKVEMKDDFTKVEITKTDFVSGEPVIGAKLKILDEEGKKVASWKTDGQPYYIEKLKPGQYTLVETYAPNGYLKAEAVEFVVEETGEIQKVEMKDRPYIPSDEYIPDTGDKQKLFPLLLFALVSFCVIIAVRKTKGDNTK